MDTTTEDTAQQLLQSFMRMHKVEWHPPTVAGCTSAEMRVLFSIRRGMHAHAADMIRVTEIGKMLQVTTPTITQWIKALEARGLVERHDDAEDRRVVYIQLTAQGQQVTQAAAETMRASIRGLIAHLGEDRSAQLASLLNAAWSYFHDQSIGAEHAPRNGDQTL